MPHRFLAAALVALSASAVSAASCPSQSISVQCTSRCAGLDNSSTYASSNPPPEQVLAPPNAEVSAQLANEVAAASPPKRKFGIFIQMSNGGSPTVPSTPNDSNFSSQTVYTPSHRALSPEQLMALVGPVHGIEWTPVKQSTLRCVDGRHATGGLYAYGGDLGEFTLALSVLEHVGQRTIGQAETTSLLEGWLQRLSEAGGGFGGCIDAAAATSLASAVGTSSDLDLSSPPEEARPALLLRLVAPEFVGNEHLKWQLHYPKTYATRRALVEQAVRSFYGILWNRHHPSHAVVQLDTLSGQRAERAVVHVHTSHWCATEQGLAPALPAKARGGSMLVFHPDAVAARRDALVKYLAATVSPPVDRADLGGRVRTLGDGQAALTEKSLAGMLRSYTLMVK